MSSDAQIAREWASKALDNDLLDEVPIAGYRAAARHILATTPAPTMADIAWDDEVHVGLCADHPDNGMVRMIHAENALIWCYHGTRMGWLAKADLTPIPGTRVDLAPRRDPEPESTPDHPEFLETEDDYENAPEGTIFAEDDGSPSVLVDGLWRSTYPRVSDHYEMAGIRRRVLRRGWEA